MALTDEQLELRLQGIAASEVGAIAGVSKFMKPIDLYRVKRKIAEAVEGFDIERGNYFEMPAMQWYADRYGMKLEFPGTTKHPELPLIIATPDGVATDKDGNRVLVEVKCPRRFTPHVPTAEDDERYGRWGAPGSDEIPYTYRAQVLFGMAVTGLRTAHVIRLSDDIDLYVVEWDQDAFDALHLLAQDFWNNHVLPGIPPPEDGSESYNKYISLCLPVGIDPIDEDEDEEMYALADAYAKASSEFKAAERDKQLTMQKIKMRIGERQGLSGGWGKVYFRNCKDSVKINWEEAARAAGASEELLRKHTTVTSGSRGFKFYKKKD